MLCSVALLTQMVEHRITLKCKFKRYVKPMKDPMHWVLALVKGIREKKTTACRLVSFAAARAGVT